MPDRIPVPPPSPQEEARLLAEAIADLEAIVSVIVENRQELLPGEAADELATAWAASRQSFARLANTVRSSNMGAALKQHELTGSVGKAKRSMLRRLRDGFYMYWNSEPRTDEKRLKAGGAAADFLEYAATIVGSIPGGGFAEEILLLMKQAVGLRAKRGH